MPDFCSPDALPEFATAAQLAATPQTLVTVQFDAEVVDWFQKNQPAGMNWQHVDQHPSGTPARISRNPLTVVRNIAGGWGPDRCRSGP